MSNDSRASSVLVRQQTAARAGMSTQTSRDAKSSSVLVRFCDAFLQEKNIKWVLGLGILVLLGSSLILVTVHWDSASPCWQEAMFLGYTAALYGAGLWAYHRLGLRRTGTALFGLTVLLIPILLLVLPSVLAERTSADVLATVILGGLILALSGIAALHIFRHFLHAAQPTFLVSYLSLATAGAFVPLLPVSQAAATGLLLWVVFAAGAIKVSRHIFWLVEERHAPRIIGFFPMALLAAQFLTLFFLSVLWGPQQR